MGSGLHVVGWPLVFMEGLHRSGFLHPQAKLGLSRAFRKQSFTRAQPVSGIAVLFLANFALQRRN